MVKATSPKLLPKGYDLAPGFANFGKVRAQSVGQARRPRYPTSPRRSAARPASPSATRARSPSAASRRPAASGRGLIAEGAFSASGGKTKTLRLKMNRRGRRYFKSHNRLRVEVRVSTAESVGADTPDAPAPSD